MLRTATTGLISMSATLDQLVKIRSQPAEALLAYLDALGAKANVVPPYYPKDVRLKRVHVHVRVSWDQQKFDPVRAAEQERSCRAGLSDEETLARAYAHRFSREGAAGEA